MGDSLPLDTVEQGFVTAIATAHGGYVDGSKDTIHAMNIVDESYDSVQIRCKLLLPFLDLQTKFQMIWGERHLLKFLFQPQIRRIMNTPKR